MKRDASLITAALLAGLFIYLFYRTKATLVIKLLVFFIGSEAYLESREVVQARIELPELVVFSLPEALWIFCITLSSRFFYIKVGALKVAGILVPLLFCLGFELLQLGQITNGRFDLMDIALSLLFWSIAVLGFRTNVENSNFFRTLDRKSILCVLTYSIVYLSHVSA